MRALSYSRAAVATALEIAELRGARTVLLDPRELDLPMFLPDTPIDGYPEICRAAIRALIDACRDADAMIWAAPTYHGTVSGAFKNAIDFIEFLSDAPAPYLTGRAVGLIAVSDPITLTTMRCCVHELRAWCAPTQLSIGSAAFDAQHKMQDERISGRLARLVGELLDFSARKHL